MKMDKQTLIELSKELNLSAFTQALINQYQLSRYENMDFAERLGELLQSQCDFTRTKRLTRNKKQAKLRWPDAKLEESLKNHSEVNKLLSDILQEFSWVKSCENIVITGKTGAGKTYLACAIANAALQLGITVIFKRFYELLLELIAAENDQQLVRFRRKLNRTQILVIDDWGLAPLSERERHLLFEFIESRERNASLIITSQYDVKDWHSAFQDQTLADSILDRIVSYAHIIKLEGESARSIRHNGGDYE